MSDSYISNQVTDDQQEKNGSEETSNLNLPPFAKKSLTSQSVPAAGMNEPIKAFPASVMGRPRKPENAHCDQVYLTVKIDRDLHQRMRSLSFHSEQSIKSIVEKWILEHTPEI